MNTPQSGTDGTNSPNIIYIMADDLGYGDLSCYGADKISTPHIDRLADEGMCFMDAHSSSAVCTPSRYSVLTGRYCWRTIRTSGVGSGFSVPLIDPSRQTIASMLKRHGYSTAAVGKWHVGLGWHLRDLRPGTGMHQLCEPSWDDVGQVDYSKPIFGGPTHLGFDYFFGIAGSLDMPPYCFIENDRTVGIPSVEKSPYNAQQRKGCMTPDWDDAKVDTTFAEKAVEFIEQHHASRHSRFRPRDGNVRQPYPTTTSGTNLQQSGYTAKDDQPFFLYLTPSAPHRPCVPPDFMVGASQAGPRGDMVMMVDWMVGQVCDTLDRLGLADNTLILVTSDNGARPADVDGNTYGHKSCGELRGYKADIYDGGHREPLVVRWPGRVQPGATSQEMVCLADVFATCAELLGDDLDDTTAEDSFSFLPYLLGQDATGPIRDTVIHHAANGMFAIRSHEWKLIDGLGSGGFSQPRREEPVSGGPEGQLFNMRSDWREQHDQWTNEPDVVADLSDQLARARYTGRTRP